jgi:hypothetical protein
MNNGGFFIQIPIEMLESPARRVLSRAALMILTRLEIEYSRHKRRTNGNLIVTFDDFVEFGIHRQAIKPALRELETLGFIKIRYGSAGNASGHRPNVYRITYFSDADGNPPTDEWRTVTTMAEAAAVAVAARQPSLGRPIKEETNSEAQ